MFGRKKQRPQQALPVQTVPKERLPGLSQMFTQGKSISRPERQLYRSLRESVPVIDAAVCKIVRLIGAFHVVTEDAAAQHAADAFVKNVRVNGCAQGLNAFVWNFLDSLLTYGTAVGEMIPSPDVGGIAALYNASLDDVTLRMKDSPLCVEVCTLERGAETPVQRQQLVLYGLLHQVPGTVRGTSVLSGLPFVSSVLLRIFTSLKNNWERAGDIRFAVTCRPEANGGVFTEENARQIADEWKKAMRSDTVCDFVSVGDVSVKVIGAENQIPDCEVPVRILLEQILSKLGLPPFLLGLSWSSTERMSVQQVDILTSELEYYRSVLEPVIRKAVGCHLQLSGWNDAITVAWEDINLQDAVELSQARLNNAQAAKIEAELGREVQDE